ncbi:MULTISPECIES: ABC1 kinase family protein [unclassified Kitasatospora]|uniref:ABC1 kinase family protein n=1 Tax=unclassified Kitasatospora TaxID=2633591 RepID=UPI0037F1481E
MTGQPRKVGRWDLVARFCQVLLIVGRHLLRAAARRLSPGRGRAARADSALPALLIALGPFFVKGGQLLSTRRDLLPARICQALGGLTDAVPAPPAAAIEAVARAAYGPPERWPFASVGWEPVAAGSIATVHRAVLLDGREVALKVRRPGVARALETDLRLITAVVRAGRWVPSLRKLPAEEMVRQVGGAILGQLDLTAELASLHTLRRNLAGVAGVRLPEPYDAFCSEETVVMEFMTGLGRFSPDARPAPERREIVRTVLLAVYRMLFLDGTVHCDLHPGNLYLTDRSEVVVLDAGFVVRLPDRVRRLFGEFFLNMALGRGRRCADITIESAAVVPETCDLESFRAAVEKLVAEATGALSGDFDLAAFAPRLFRVQRDHGIFAAAEFAFPLLSMLVIEGMIKEFDAGVDFQAEAVPVLMEALRAPAD